MSSNKIRVAVLYGGRSAEHEISLLSASNVIQHLDSRYFDVVPMGIDKNGNWYLGKELFTKSIEHKKIPMIQNEIDTWFTPEWIGTSSVSSLLSSSAKTTAFDVIFPAVHGTFCEDGSLQGLLELAEIPYVGCNVLSSAIGMDKDVSKRLAMQADIPVVPYKVIKYKQWQQSADTFIQEISKTLGYPLFVKPANTGSSIGINKVKTEEALRSAIIEAFQFDLKVVVEKALVVRELEVAVLESLEPEEDPIVSIVGEVKSTHEFYSYEAKYLDENGAQLLIPAPLSKELYEEARQMAKTLFLLLECEGMTRVDLFLETTTQKIYFNEINTLPGFTQISMYPKLMAASGISYSELLTHLIQLAMNKHARKKQLIRQYLE